jgi:hypothetical protein
MSIKAAAVKELGDSLIKISQRGVLEDLKELLEEENLEESERDPEKLKAAINYREPKVLL